MLITSAETHQAHKSPMWTRGLKKMSPGENDIKKQQRSFKYAHIG